MRLLILILSLHASEPAAELKQKPDFLLMIQSFRKSIATQKWKQPDCANFLNEANQELFQRPLHQFDLTSLKTWPREGILALSQTRTELQEKLTPACRPSARQTLQQLRALRESLGSWALPGQDRWSRFESLQAPATFFTPGQGLGDAKPVSGDLLFARDWDQSSGSTQQLFFPPTVFNRIGLVLENSVLEVTHGDGLKLVSLPEFLDTPWLRFELLRPRNPEDAKSASARASLLIKKPVLPDFNAGELIKYAYSDKKFSPLLLNKIQPHFKSAHNLARSTILTAEDIENAEAFRPVFEWTHYAKIHLALRHDAVLFKLFDWLAIEGLEPVPSIKAWAIASSLWPIRGVPWVGDLVSSYVPDQITFHAYRNLQDLAQISFFLLDELRQQDILMKSLRFGVPLSYSEMLGALQTFRQFDSKSKTPRLFGSYLKLNP